MTATGATGVNRLPLESIDATATGVDRRYSHWSQSTATGATAGVDRQPLESIDATATGATAGVDQPLESLERQPLESIDTTTTGATGVDRLESINRHDSHHWSRLIDTTATGGATGTLESIDTHWSRSTPTGVDRHPLEPLERQPLESIDRYWTTRGTTSDRYRSNSLERQTTDSTGATSNNNVTTDHTGATGDR